MTRHRFDCSQFRDHLEGFIHGHHERAGSPRASRIAPAALSAHLESCLRCGEALSRRLGEIGREEAARTAAEQWTALGATRCPNGERPSGECPSGEYLGTRRWAAIVMRTSQSDFEQIRDQVGRVVARRALRYVATQDGRRLEAAACAAAEIVDAKAAIRRLNEIASAFDAAIAAEMYELASWLEDVEHVAESFEKLRRSGVLVPRPPTLPRPGDHLGRERVVSWAARLLGRSPSA